MADFILAPLTALGHAAPVVDQIGPWTITERADVALASLAIRRGQAEALRALAAGASLPLPEVARAAGGAIYGAFWIAPEMWMVEAPFASHEDISAHLKAIFAETASITEQTDAWVRFDLEGPGLTRLFERLSNFDLAKAGPGAAARTVIDHLGCYLITRSDTLVSLYGPRSSAQSLHHALIVAARSVL